jgi:predicted MFS family arabinose efflux permease
VRDVNSISARIAAITINVICITYYNIMPLVLGGAAESHGLAESHLGFAASAFMGGLAAINFAGFAWLRRFDWRTLLVTGNLIAVIGFIIPIFHFSVSTWILCNFIAGAATGISYGVSIACLGDTREPERNFALAYAGQTFLSAGIILTMPRIEIGYDLFVIGQGICAVLMASAVALVAILPGRGAKIGIAVKTRETTGPDLRQTALILALLLLMLNVMAEGAVWAFIERIAVSEGFTTTFAATAMAFSFFASGAGSMAAATMGRRFGSARPFVIAVAMSIASVWVMWAGGTEAIFFIGVMLFALAWNLGSPYRMALATRADDSGRYSTFVPAMQTSGAALGPAVAGLLVVNGSFTPVFVMSTIAWLITLVLFFAAAKRLGLR